MSSVVGVDSCFTKNGGLRREQHVLLAIQFCPSHSDYIATLWILLCCIIIIMEIKKQIMIIDLFFGMVKICIHFSFKGSLVGAIHTTVVLLLRLGKNLRMLLYVMNHYVI